MRPRSSTRGARDRQPLPLDAFAATVRAAMAQTGRRTVRRLTVVILAAAMRRRPAARRGVSQARRARRRRERSRSSGRGCRSATSSRIAASTASARSQFQQTMTPRLRDLGGGHQRAGLVGVRRLHGRVAGAGRRRHGARLSESSRHRAHARRDVLPDRHDDRRHRRVRHLLQLVLPVVRRGGRGRRTSFDLESIAVHEIGHLHGLAHSAHRRDRVAGRRPPGDRRRVGDVPGRLLGRQHLRPHAQGGRHRRHLRHLPGGRIRRARPAASAAR